MNILLKEFPETINVDGVEYGINTDYKFGLYTILAFEDKGLTAYEKVCLMLENLLSDEYPENIEETAKRCQWFLNAGKESKPVSGHRLYSFSKDAELIFSAFKQTHDVDLQTVEMHWWKFLAYFMDLGANTAFCQLVGLRDRYYSGKATKEEKAHIRKMGDVFYVEQNELYTLEELETMNKIKESYRKAKEARNAARL